MTAKEEALRIYTRFTVYRWSETDGYIPDDTQTLRLSICAVEESKRHVYDIDCADFESYKSRQQTLRFLTSIIKELKKI